ncbi:MAG: peptidoglycan-binding domain-containing protein, partial [Patescibacteria group bacterium]
GKVGPQTLQKLNELLAGSGTPPPPPPRAPSTGETPPTTAPFTKDLAMGDRGEEVTRLQEFLAKDPDVYPQGQVTGYFGALTKQAVKNFQKKYGIAPVGRVGPQTRAKLNELLGASPASSSGGSVLGASTSSGNAQSVQELQEKLRVLQDQLNALLASPK